MAPRRVLVAALTTSLSAASTTTLDWVAQFSANPKTATMGADADLVFSWTGHHDVWEMASESAYEACDFGGGAYLGAATGVAVAARPGETVFYSCSVGAHCIAGQKVAVTWDAPLATPAPPAPAPTASPVAATAAPSPRPAPSPTAAPTASPVAATAPPSPRPAPSPTAAPTAGSCADDEAWHKKHAPAKNCAWVANFPEDRCAAKGDEAQAWQACPETCGTCPYECAGDSASWHKNGHGEKDCDWVSGFYYNRASVVGEDGTLAFESCASATRRCFYEGYRDSNTWAKKDQPWKDCAWAAAATSRCVALGEDGTFGYESCQHACLVGAYADDDAAWAKKNGPSKDCAWVARDRLRCAVKGEDDRWAFQACPAACGS
ncbi:FK506 binding protein [Aureococcus anophagefferens]|nr:FK506 binding protein [Aureococcus anophagefferens]